MKEASRIMKVSCFRLSVTKRADGKVTNEAHDH